VTPFVAFLLVVIAFALFWIAEEHVARRRRRKALEKHTDEIVARSQLYPGTVDRERGRMHGR
jgi:hypothetical protein